MTLVLKSASCGCSHGGLVPYFLSESRSGTQCTYFSYGFSGGGFTGAVFNAYPLPSGLTVDGVTGFITGTPNEAWDPGVDGTITLQGTNSCGTGYGTFTLTIAADTGCTVPIINPIAGEGTVGTALSYSIALSNTPTGTPVYSADTALPSGLTLNTSTGVISGTPTAVFHDTVTITVTTCCGSDTDDIQFDIGSALCALTLDTSGGDSGYDQTFDVTGDFAAARDIYVGLETYTIKDQLLIDANGSNIYDSGCIGAQVTPTVNVPSGTTSVRVRIIPLCDGGSGTAWILSITCASL